MLETVLNKDNTAPRHSLIVPRLIIRESCGSPAS